MARLDKERQQRLEPERMEKALEEIKKMELEIVDQTTTTIEFLFKGSKIIYHPYSGWHTGKTIVDGRGWMKLYNQIKVK
jgi:hypothetical protein